MIFVVRFFCFFGIGFGQLFLVFSLVFLPSMLLAKPLEASPDSSQQALSNTKKSQTNEPTPVPAETPAQIRILEDSKLPVNSPSFDVLLEESPESSTKTLPADTAGTDSISESFAPPNRSKYDFVKSFLEDSSLVFQKKQTKHKFGLLPNYVYNRTSDSRLGLSLFAFESKKEGYYTSLVLAKYFSLFEPSSLFTNPYGTATFTYLGSKSSVFRSEIQAIYDNYPENYYNSKATDDEDHQYEYMQAPLAGVTELPSHRFKINYDIFYQKKKLYRGADSLSALQKFYQKVKEKHYLGLGLIYFLRIPSGTNSFPKENFVFARAFAGFDSRDNWKYPTQGAFHQLSFGCKASLDFTNSYCQTHGDLRFYISFLKNVYTGPPLLQKTTLSLRAFYGTSLFNPASYGLKYSLGYNSFFQNINTLRGFKSHRFIGDKMYLLQSELRVPLWEEYLIGALFFELGEVAKHESSFSGFVYDYGGGFRIGWPEDTGMKVRIDYGTGKDRQNKRNYDFTIAFLQAF